MKKIVDGTLSFCAQRFNYHGVKLAIDEIPAGLQVECRETEISQVLLNLLSNAYDVVEKLEEKWVRLSVKDLGDRVSILVTDSGKGIPPEIRAKIFQPFFTTKEIGKGTGLGLGISTRIIENHGGTLSVNAECENTQFVISIPKRQQQALRASA